MVFNISISDDLKKDLRKLKKKDPILFSRIQKKTKDIARQPEGYKTLKYMKGQLKRVHIDPFVLIFRIQGDVVEFITIEHHDKAYA